jgi:hypothetical protein
VNPGIIEILDLLLVNIEELEELQEMVTGENTEIQEALLDIMEMEMNIHPQMKQLHVRQC